MKEIIIGRDGETGKLRLTVGAKTAVFGEQNSVPRSVSQQHARLTIGDDGILVLHNLNIDNDTYVNHQGVERKRVQPGDRIVLGDGHYRLDWDMLQPFIPKMADIAHLEKVWTGYQQQRLQMQIRERRFNALKSATGILTMSAVVLGALTGRDNPLFTAIYGVAAVAMLVSFVITYRQASKIPLMQDELLRNTKQQYKCPECGSLLTLQDYDMLRQTKGCPHCGAVWKK